MYKDVGRATIKIVLETSLDYTISANWIWIRKWKKYGIYIAK